MSLQQSEFLLGRAAEERQLAARANLANVRDGHLRAAEAWDRLAARAVKADRMRAEEIKRKAEVAASETLIAGEAIIAGEPVVAA